MHAKCLNCGSTHIVEASKLIDYDAPFKFSAVVQVLRNPRAYIFKGALELKIHPDICEDCGHVMLGVVPSELKAK